MIREKHSELEPEQICLREWKTIAVFSSATFINVNKNVFMPNSEQKPFFFLFSNFVESAFCRSVVIKESSM